MFHGSLVPCAERRIIKMKIREYETSDLKEANKELLLDAVAEEWLSFIYANRKYSTYVKYKNIP